MEMVFSAELSAEIFVPFSAVGVCLTLAAGGENETSAFKERECAEGNL